MKLSFSSSAESLLPEKHCLPSLLATPRGERALNFDFIVGIWERKVKVSVRIEMLYRLAITENQLMGIEVVRSWGKRLVVCRIYRVHQVIGNGDIRELRIKS